MEITKRSIPRIASAGLLLGGGCSSSSGHATPNDVAFEFCQSLDLCGNVYTSADARLVYAYDYASTSQCRSASSNYYANFASHYDSLFGVNCGDAYLDYYACFWDVYADTCYPDTAIRVCQDFAADIDFFCR